PIRSAAMVRTFPRGVDEQVSAAGAPTVTESVQLGLAGLRGLGDLAEAVLVFPHVLGERADDSLQMAGADDDARVDDPLRRKDVHEVEEELLPRMADHHLVGIDPL